MNIADSSTCRNPKECGPKVRSLQPQAEKWCSDNALGRRLAKEYIELLRVDKDVMPLVRKFQSMIANGQVGGIETGFVTVIAANLL